MNYTKGPWYNPANHVGVYGGRNMVLIADCGNTRYPQETKLANARLIAAAPEMVELLESMLDLFNPYAHCIKGDRGIEVIQSVVSVLNKIKGV